jgi:hypothetical protein
MGAHVISWIDFADAVELFLDKLDRMRDLYGRSHRARYNPDALQKVNTSGARALMELSRNVFHKSQDSRTLTRLMDLESLVLSTTHFAVTDARDVIYALLHLASDIVHNPSHSSQTGPSQGVFPVVTDYSRHPVDIFADFVIYCFTKSRSLDVICRHWTAWPRPAPRITFHGRELPSWIRAASFAPDPKRLSPLPPSIPVFSLVGAPRKPIYAASHNVELSWKKLSNALEVTGLILGHVRNSPAPIVDANIREHQLQTLGWTGSFADGVPDGLWRSLVANRTTDGRLVPGWYRRACALALTKLASSKELKIPKLLADASQPSTMVEYLKRVQEVVQSRKCLAFTPEISHDRSRRENDATATKRAVVGMCPQETSSGDLVCILFGCSVPVILRPVYVDAIEDAKDEIQNFKLIGEAYVHDHMEGEILLGMTKEERVQRSTTFRIH